MARMVHSRLRKAIRIRASNPEGVAYVHNEGDGSGWRCTQMNGRPASFWYAGLRGDVAMAVFELSDALSSAGAPQAALDVMKKHGSAGFKYKLV